MLAPVEVVEIELGDALPRLRPAPGARGGAARALVRLHGRPLGLVDLPLAPGGLSPDGCARLVWSELRAEIAAHLAGDGLAPVTALTADGLPTARGPAPCAAAHGAARARGRTEPVSVVIATRDRPGPLARCLASLARLDHPAFEVIVVDNAPATTATRDLVAREHPEVRYVREDRPGLAAAHNRGLADAGGAIVAITDDDVTVDPRWLLEIAAGFARDPRIGCVTGLILPAELRTPAQVWADRHWRVAKGFRERRTRGRCGIAASARTPTRPAPSARARTWRSARRRSAPGTASTPAWARGHRPGRRRPRRVLRGHRLGPRAPLHAGRARAGTGTPRTSTRCDVRRTATAPASPRTSRRSSPTIRSGSWTSPRERLPPWRTLADCPGRAPPTTGGPRHRGGGAPRMVAVHAYTRGLCSAEAEGRVTWLYDDVDTLAAALTDGGGARRRPRRLPRGAGDACRSRRTRTDREPPLRLDAAGRVRERRGWPGRGAAATAGAAGAPVG